MEGISGWAEKASDAELEQATGLLIAESQRRERKGQRRKAFSRQGEQKIHRLPEMRRQALAQGRFLCVQLMRSEVQPRFGDLALVGEAATLEDKKNNHLGDAGLPSQIGQSPLKGAFDCPSFPVGSVIIPWPKSRVPFAKEDLNFGCFLSQ